MHVVRSLPLILLLQPLLAANPVKTAVRIYTFSIRPLCKAVYTLMAIDWAFFVALLKIEQHNVTGKDSTRLK